MTLPRLLKEAVRSGTIASIAMMPFGLLLKAFDLRVGHYGPKLGEFIFGLQQEPWLQAPPCIAALSHEGSS